MWGRVYIVVSDSIKFIIPFISVDDSDLAMNLSTLIMIVRKSSCTEGQMNAAMDGLKYVIKRLTINHPLCCKVQDAIDIIKAMDNGNATVPPPSSNQYQPHQGATLSSTVQPSSNSTVSQSAQQNGNHIRRDPRIAQRAIEIAQQCAAQSQRSTQNGHHTVISPVQNGYPSQQVLNRDPRTAQRAIEVVKPNTTNQTAAKQEEVVAIIKQKAFQMAQENAPRLAYQSGTQKPIYSVEPMAFDRAIPTVVSHDIPPNGYYNGFSNGYQMAGRGVYPPNGGPPQWRPPYKSHPYKQNFKKFPKKRTGFFNQVKVDYGLRRNIIATIPTDEILKFVSDNMNKNDQLKNGIAYIANAKK